MLRQISIIPLRITPYNDRSSILAAYSLEMGRVSFLLPAGASREAQRRRALLRPLCPIQCVASSAPGRELMQMREPRPIFVAQHLMCNPLRASMALFLADVLGAVLRQSESEPLLFEFIVDAARRLNDPATPVANFHLAFLMKLGQFVGICPDGGSWRPGYVFDMRDAVFRATPPLHADWLEPLEAQALERLSRIEWDTMHIYKYTRAQRARVLDLILEFYTLHHVNLRQLRSLPVLHDLFNE
jgi:DNA repair protein RecO (recombination protein O)